MAGSNHNIVRKLRSLAMRSVLALTTTFLIAGTLSVINAAPADAAILPDTVISTIGGFNGAWGTAVNPVTDMLYVTNIGSNSISVIDASTNSVTTTIAVGASPYEAAVNTVTNMVYVANNGSNTVSVMGGANNTVTATIGVGGGPDNVAVDPITDLIYVSNGGSNTVSVINGATNGVVATIGVGSNPQGIGVDAATNTIYVANYGSNSVSVINGATNAVTSTIPVGSNPQAISIDSQTDMIYVTNYNSNSLSIINGATSTTTVSIPVGANPYGVTVDTNNNMIYVANGGSGTVSVVNGLANAAVDTINVGNGPRGLAVNPQTNFIYAANYGSNTVSVIAGATPAWNYATSTQPTTVGSSPQSVAVDPATNLAYVTNKYSNTVSVFNTVTDAVTATIGVESEPQGIAVDAATNTIYVANSFSNTVSVINGATNMVTATLTGFSTPYAVAVDLVTDTIYVTNDGTETVSVINGATNAITATIDGVAYQPFSIAVNSVTNTIYVALAYYNDGVAVINGATNTLTTTITGIPWADSVAVDPANNTIWTANEQGTVSVINGATNSVTETISGWQSPYGIAIDPLNGLVYVSDSSASAQRVLVVDGATGQIVDSVATGLGAMGMAVNPNNNTAYVVMSGSDNIQELSWIAHGVSYAVDGIIRTGNIEDFYPTSVAVNPITNMAYATNSFNGATSTGTPDGIAVVNAATNILQTTILNNISSSNYAIAVDSATNMVYAGEENFDTEGGNLQVVSGKTNVTVANLAIGGPIYGVAVNPITDNIYAEDGGNIAVINGSTNAVTANISIAGGAYGIAVDSATNMVYAADPGSNTVSVINGATNVIVATIPVGSEPQEIAVDSVTNMVYVTNYGSNTVSVINGATNGVTATIGVGSYANSITTDYITNTIYVGNTSLATISVIDGSTNAIVATIPAQAGYPPNNMTMNNRTNTLYFTTTNNTPAMFAITGRLIPTTVSTITPSANPAYVGAPVTYTATVSPAPEFATMGFTSDGTTISGCGYVPVNKSTGTASCTTTYSGTGTYSIVAANSGDVNYAPSTSPTLSEVVSQIPTATNLSSSADPVLSDNLVTYTATVSPTVGGAPTPTSGTVGFTDNGTAINGCTAQSLNASGQATCELPYAAPGSHAIVASYSGSTDYLSSSSGTLTETITSPTVSVPTLSAGSTTLSVGQSTTLTATGPSEPTGTSIAMNIPSGVTGSGASGCYTSTGGSMTCSENVTSNTAGTYNFSATANLAGNQVPDSNYKYYNYPNHGTWGNDTGLPMSQISVSNAGSDNATMNVSGPFSGEYVVMQSQIIPVTPGDTYTISGSANTSGMTSGGAMVDAYNTSISIGYSSSNGISAGTSGTSSSTFTIPSGVTQILVFWDLGNGAAPSGSAISLGPIQLTQSSSVEPYAPGAIAASSATSNSVSISWTQPLTPPVVSASPTTQTVANSVTITAVGTNEGSGVTVGFNNPANVSQVSQNCTTSGSTITCTEAVTTTVAGTYDFSATAYPPPGVSVSPDASNIVGVTWNQPAPPSGYEFMPTSMIIKLTNGPPPNAGSIPRATPGTQIQRT